MCGFPVSEVLVLVVSGKAFLLDLIESGSFDDHAIVDFTAQGKRLMELGFLRFCRIESVFYAENAHNYIIQLYYTTILYNYIIQFSV